MAVVTLCSDFGAQKNKVWHCFYFPPIYLPWSLQMVIAAMKLKDAYSLEEKLCPT